LVLPGEILPGAHVDHGFNGKDVARLHKSNSLVLAVVGNLRGTMEDAANAVASVAADHRQTQGLNMVADNVSALAIHSVGFAVLNGLLKGIVSGLD
jgi:hypothetical protein